MFGKRYDNVTAFSPFDDRTVAVILPPGAGFAIDA
jgi:hypothetical protein